MKGIINFCKITCDDYVVEALPNGGLKATIDCVYPPHVEKIKEMAEDRGYTVDISEYGEIVIYSEEGWEDTSEKYQSEPLNYVDVVGYNEDDITINNKYGEPLNYEDVMEYMDDDIREYLHHQLAPCSAQFFYDEYCKMHKGIYGVDFEDEYFTEEGYLRW